MASEPDAYGYMGMGVALIAAACATVVWTFFPIPVYHLAIGSG